MTAIQAASVMQYKNYYDLTLTRMPYDMLWIQYLKLDDIIPTAEKYATPPFRWYVTVEKVSLNETERKIELEFAHLRDLYLKLLPKPEHVKIEAVGDLSVRVTFHSDHRKSSELQDYLHSLDSIFTPAISQLFSPTTAHTDSKRCEKKAM